MKYYKKTILNCINVVKNHKNQSFLNRYIGVSVPMKPRETNERPKELKTLVTHTIVHPLGTISQGYASQFEKKPQPKINV